MGPPSSEPKPGTDECGDVKRGPLKNDVSISMLILGFLQNSSFSRNSRTGYLGSAALQSVGGRGRGGVTQHWHSPHVASLPDPSWIDLLLLENSVGSSLPLKDCHRWHSQLISPVLSRSKHPNEGKTLLQEQSVVPTLIKVVFSTTTPCL